MAKRLAQRAARTKRSHQVGEDEKIIPINHETAESIAQQGSCFENSLAVNRGRMIDCFFDWRCLSYRCDIRRVRCHSPVIPTDRRR